MKKFVISDDGESVSHVEDASISDIFTGLFGYEIQRPWYVSNRRWGRMSTRQRKVTSKVAQRPLNRRLSTFVLGHAVAAITAKSKRGPDLGAFML